MKEHKIPKSKTILESKRMYKNLSRVFLFFMVGLVSLGRQTYAIESREHVATKKQANITKDKITVSAEDIAQMDKITVSAEDIANMNMENLKIFEQACFIAQKDTGKEKIVELQKLEKLIIIKRLKNEINRFKKINGEIRHACTYEDYEKILGEIDLKGFMNHFSIKSNNTAVFDYLANDILRSSVEELNMFKIWCLKKKNHAGVEERAEIEKIELMLDPILKEISDNEAQKINSTSWIYQNNSTRIYPNLNTPKEVKNLVILEGIPKALEDRRKNKLFYSKAMATQKNEEKKEILEKMASLNDKAIEVLECMKNNEDLNTNHEYKNLVLEIQSLTNEFYNLPKMVV